MDVRSQSRSFHEFINVIVNIKRLRFGVGLCFSLITLFITMPAVGSEGRIIRVPEPVAGQYLVVLKNVSRANVPDIANQMAQGHNGRVRRIINNTASIFSIELTEQEAVRLSRHPKVLSVEEVGYIRLSGGINLPAGAGTTATSGPLWNLDRIDQTSPDPNLRYNYCERGAGVIAYVVDTGVLRTHSEFLRSDGTSRVKSGVCKSMDCQGFEPGDACTGDFNESQKAVAGHGTAVASVLGGKNIGAAPNVGIVPIRVTSCPLENPTLGLSTTENICWGLDWIRGSQNPDRDHRPALINMSVYANATRINTGQYKDPYVTALEHVISGLVNDYDPNFPDEHHPEPEGWTGIPVIVSANNLSTENSETTPARMAYRNAPNFDSRGRVISVGGTELLSVEDSENPGVFRLLDKRWVCTAPRDGECKETISNGDNNFPIGSAWGNTVDIWAPAHNIQSAHSDGGFRQTLRSGTSFAAPLVAGVAARILQVMPNLSQNEVYQQLIASASNTFVPGKPETAIDPLTWNSRVVRRLAEPVCSPEYP